MSFPVRARLLPALLCLLACAPAWAGVSCALSGAAVGFGNYDVFSLLPNDSSGTMTLTCNQTGGTGSVDSFSYTVAIGSGTYGSFSERRMANGLARMGYNLYTTPLRLLVWGDGSGGTFTVGGLGCVGNTVIANPLCPGTLAVPLTVYARIPALQDVRVGSYADTVVVTVSY